MIFKIIIKSIIFFLYMFSISSAQTYQQELFRLKRSVHYRLTNITPNIINIKYNLSGIEKDVVISDIGNTLNLSDKDLQVFDLINVDTLLYNEKYKFKYVLPLGGSLGYPLIFNDFNKNENIDIVGQYKIPCNVQPADCAIFELTEDSTFSMQAIYPDTVVIPIAATDLDEDGLMEINFRIEGGQEFYNYENKFTMTYPETLNFTYRMWDMDGTIGSETFTDLDRDGAMDVIYKGDDTLHPAGTKIYIAEYSKETNNFIKRYNYRLTHWRTSGISYGDYDNDGFTEFVTGSIDGDVYVFENTGDNSYEFVFEDTIPTPNAYLNCSTNDIDRNGKKEFFIGGSSFYNGIGGTRVYWFEADGDNHYVKKYNFFLLGTDVLGTTELYNYDVNADGYDDLVFAFGLTIVILTWNQGGFFEIYYLDWWEDLNQEIDAVTMFDLFKSGKLDLLVTVDDYIYSPSVRSYLFRNNCMTSIPANYKLSMEELVLFPNTPNPFNLNTTITFKLFKNSEINLTVYGLTGKEVCDLIKNKILNPGLYSIIWDGKDLSRKEVSSGIYFVHLKSEHSQRSIKMLMIK